ncbi:MAG: hypothetical protein E7330_07290 [Clostridiales bacterium]|nr:hypothetical protein [Clostridiales bacterium]
MQPGFHTIDLHGKTRVQAKIAVDAALRRADASCYRLRLIHGHNSGTGIREFIREEYAVHPKVKRILPGANPGITELVLREL